MADRGTAFPRRRRPTFIEVEVILILVGVLTGVAFVIWSSFRG